MPNRFILVLFLFATLPTDPSQADMISIPPAAQSSLPGLMKDEHDLEYTYAFSKLTLHHKTPAPLTIDHSAKPSKNNAFSWMPAAEASIPELNAEHFKDVFNAVNQARGLDDLRPVVTERNILLLEQKVKEGVSQYVILGMIQSMRPKDIKILDSMIVENRATASVAGWSHFGPMQGKVDLVQKDGLWKIEREEWHASADYTPIYTFLSPHMKFTEREGLLSQVSPDCKVNGNFLGLMRVPFRRESRKISFVFLMNKSTNSEKDKNIPGEEAIQQKKRGRMHLLWTASKKFPKEQQIDDYNYPMDVSVARFDDGFAPNEWNVVLPRKKPRGADVSLLWSF